MIYRLLADATWLLQLAFIVSVVAGGLFLLRWPRPSWLPWLHLPAVFPAGHLCCWLERRVADRPWPHHSVLPRLSRARRDAAGTRGQHPQSKQKGNA
jgi:hypothetical protein